MLRLPGTEFWGRVLEPGSGAEFWGLGRAIAAGNFFRQFIYDVFLYETYFR